MSESKAYVTFSMWPNFWGCVLIWVAFLCECNSCRDSRENVGAAWSAVTEATCAK